jgi:uncharacterized protein YbjT (DUF2867 family)
MIKKNINNVVIGSSWLIGTTLLNNLRERGQQVVAAVCSSSSVKSLTGEGLTGAKVVRHAGRNHHGSPRILQSSVAELAYGGYQANCLAIIAHRL